MATKFPNTHARVRGLEWKGLSSRMPFMVSAHLQRCLTTFPCLTPAAGSPVGVQGLRVREISVLSRSPGHVRPVPCGLWSVTLPIYIRANDLFSESSFILRECTYFHAFQKVQFLWEFFNLFSCYGFISVNSILSHWYINVFSHFTEKL